MLSVSNPALQQLHRSLPESTHANKCFRIMPKDEINLTLDVNDDGQLELA